MGIIITALIQPDRTLESDLYGFYKMEISVLKLITCPYELNAHSVGKQNILKR